MIAALVLAAGQSRRMGTQKLLLPFAGQTVIAHLLDQIKQSHCGPVLVVVGSNNLLHSVLSEKEVDVVENLDAYSDMLGSVRIGLQNLSADCEAAIIMPGDFPLIQTALINQMVAVFQARNQIVVPVHQEQRGHPLLVPRRYFHEVLHFYDDVGLRGLLQSHANDLCELKVDDAGVLQDIDVPEDYQKALKKWSLCNGP
ncbi:MAG TPA: nucleotidyltransferase family protein [Abditibacteriaceae bacterium]|jgi:molybdenum cofactor cytidylyltransferase